MGEPSAWVIDFEKADDLLRQTALCMAMNLATDLRETDLDSPVVNAYLKYFSPIHFLSLEKGEMNRAKALSVRVGQNGLRDRAHELYDMFYGNFRKAVGSGPSAVARYLEEKDAQHRHAWESVKYKFEAARQVNTELVVALNRWHAQTYAIKVACDAAMVVAGAVVPVNWMVNTAIGYTYSIACKVAANTSDARDASVFAHGASNSLGQSANVAQDMVDDWAVKTAREKLYADAKRQSEEASAKFLEKLRQFRAQSGENLSAAQVRRLAPFAQKAQDAVSQVDKARVALTAETKGVVDVYKTAQPAGQRAVVGIRAAGVAVGLLFILPDAIAAVQELNSNVLHDNTR
jgi:hypothetical protein